MKRMIMALVIALGTIVEAQHTNIFDMIQESFGSREQAAIVQYGKELSVLLKDAKEDGDLDKFLILEAEKKRFDAEKTVPSPADAKAEFASLSKTHHKTMVYILTKYVTAIDDLIKNKVREGLIEDAKILKAEKERALSILTETKTLLSIKEEKNKVPNSSKPASKKEWDVTKEFSNSVNPSGAWSYGVIRKPGESFVLFKNNWTHLGEIQQPVWNDGGANVWINNSPNTKYGVAPGEVSIHPGPNGEYGVIRWTCIHLAENQTEKLTVKGAFGAGDVRNMNVSIFHNGKKLFAATNTPKEEPFSLEIKIQPKDTIDFAVSPGPQGWGCGNTPLKLVISSK
jgi:hypothetical protein